MGKKIRIICSQVGDDAPRRLYRAAFSEGRRMFRHCNNGWADENGVELSGVVDMLLEHGCEIEFMPGCDLGDVLGRHPGNIPIHHPPASMWHGFHVWLINGRDYIAAWAWEHAALSYRLRGGRWANLEDMQCVDAWIYDREREEFQGQRLIEVAKTIWGSLPGRQWTPENHWAVCINSVLS